MSENTPYASEFVKHVEGSVMYPANQHSALRFLDPEGGEVFRVEWDGAVVLGPHIRPADLNAISRQFWAHLRDANPLLAENARLRATAAALYDEARYARDVLYQHGFRWAGDVTPYPDNPYREPAAK